jgi:membrane associated rhomboid family serine protease
MMANTSTDLMEIILRECAGAAPQPWYPSVYAQGTGVPRDTLDVSLDQLRLGGLVRLTDWVQGRGQGYELTSEGADIVANPRLMNRLRANGVAPRTAAAMSRAAEADDEPTTWDRGEEVRAALLDPATPKVTLALLFLNVLVFLYGCALAVRNQVPLNTFVAGMTDPKREPILHEKLLAIQHQTGAMYRGDIVADNQWWRLLTCCFVHFGLLHLLVNMYSLYAVGPLLERMWGTWRYLLLYLIAGLVGSCAMLVFSAPNFFGAGASGALWGVMASMATWVFLNRSHLPPQLVSSWKRSLLIVFILNVFITFGLPGISASAHFGGGIAGLVVGVPLEYVRRSRGWRWWLAVAGVAAVPLGALAAVEYSITPDREQAQTIAIYLPRVEELQDDESKVFREFVKPLILQPIPEWRKDPNAPAARKAVRGLQQRVQGTADVLTGAAGFRDPAVVEVVQTARVYLEAASAFYEAFQRSLDPQVAWTDQDTQTLRQQYVQLQNRRKDLEDLFRSLRRRP